MVDAPVPAERREAILEAATQVFLRYGFKKTSMDDLARAAGLSRQGLYLHFATKEALFKEALVHVVEATRAAAKAALAHHERTLDERLVSAFEAMHGVAIGQPSAERMNELLETANELVGPVVDEAEQGMIGDVVRALRSAGVSAAWKEASVSAKDLAENLYATSVGLKHRVKSVAEYRERLRVAVKLVCRKP
jgi:AcrR family transcriptional regulator